MRALLLSFCFLLLVTPADAAQLHFPALTGRVVDNAHILSAPAVASLDEKLQAYENGTGNQVVVVTLLSLQGTAIESYGYQLGRYWQIGQKGKNNGVLLIVVPSEHKVRIEVGYGLEGQLTDAAASEIVHGIILPDFRAGDMQKGVMQGTDAILSVLGGQSLSIAHYPSQTAQDPISPEQFRAITCGMFIFLLVMLLLCWRYPTFGNVLSQIFNITFIALSVYRSGSSGLGGSGWGGGFSGGGGSFGGGGASGSW